MKYSHSIFSTVCGLLLLCTPYSVLAETSQQVNNQINNIDHLAITQPDILKNLTKAQIIYLGEQHDRLADHQAQLAIIQHLHENSQQTGGKIAIALEMFQKPYQQAINDYLAGKISETELIAKTEYETRWGYEWEYYAPILRYAKKFQIPVIALNVPTEITRKVARAGLDSLTEAEKKIIPPADQIKTDNEQYRQILLEVYKQHAENEQGHSANFQRFVLAQVLWDETMAEAIAQFHAKNSDHQIVVLAGAGHIIYNYGIPDRVQRRLGEDVKQKSVLFQPVNDQSLINDKEIADYIWWVDEIN
jgi:uncharacterized iron-regulated protein